MPTPRKRLRQEAIIKQLKSTPKQQFPYWVLIIVVGVITILAAREFIIFDDDGKAELSPERKAKLAKELEELEDGEQYVLIATENKMYPCFNCGEKSRIFLKKREIWKYGVTRFGLSGRYRKTLLNQGLAFSIQFKGMLHECLMEEKIKIYNYAILPENLLRKTPLIRPSGNKQDN